MSDQLRGLIKESRLQPHLCTAELLHLLPPTLLEVVEAREAGILPVLCRKGQGDREEGGGQEQESQVLHRDGYLVRTVAGAWAGALRQEPGGKWCNTGRWQHRTVTACNLLQQALMSSCWTVGQLAMAIGRTATQPDFFLVGLGIYLSLKTRRGRPC